MEKWYKVVSRRKEKIYLDGVEECETPSHAKRTITIKPWRNKPNSFWVRLEFDNKEIIMDSGIILELAKEIEKSSV